jgi:hypothetical protein
MHYSLLIYKIFSDPFMQKKEAILRFLKRQNHLDFVHCFATDSLDDDDRFIYLNDRTL